MGQLTIYRCQFRQTDDIGRNIVWGDAAGHFKHLFGVGDL